MSENPKCLECSDPIYGRIDKKFCSDQCRTSHHNKQNSDSNNFMRNINNILRKNRRILKSLNPHDKSKATKTELLDLGFKFSYYTNEYITRAGKVYKFCYEQGYLELDNGVYALVKRKEYVD